jgi:hypothetical protein
MTSRRRPSLISHVASVLLVIPPAIGSCPAPSLAQGSPPPAPVEVRAHAEPDTTTIGTRFRYTVSVTTTSEAEVVLSQPTERIGDFEIVDFGDEPPKQAEGETTATRWYTLIGYEVGHHLVKSPPVFYRRAGEELREAPAHEIAVTIESLVEKAGAADVRDIKGPVDFPRDWRPYYLVAGALAALLVLAAILYRVLNRSRRGPAVRPRPAHEWALEDLLRLRRRGLVEQGAFKEYYSGLSDIVRAYVEQRFGVRAPEMTTEEFLIGSARNGRLQSGHRSLLADFLTESDLVKFARHVPTIADSERAFVAAKRFVDETAASLLARDSEEGLEEKRRAAG